MVLVADPLVARDISRLPGTDEFCLVFVHHAFLNQFATGGVDRVGNVGIEPDPALAIPRRLRLRQFRAALVFAVYRSSEGVGPT
jgi:hypothetical protein